MRIEYCEPEGYYLLGQAEYEGITAEAVLSRLKIAADVKTYAELAAWLGVGQSLISDIQRRNIFPVKWLHFLLEKNTRYNPVWVLTGKGEMYRTDQR